MDLLIIGFHDIQFLLMLLIVKFHSYSPAWFMSGSLTQEAASVFMIIQQAKFFKDLSFQGCKYLSLTFDRFHLLASHF